MLVLSIPVDMEKEDTDYQEWNADIFQLENGDNVALCYIPIQNDELSARIIGIILNENGDGYYYCMLNKDENEPSAVFRNGGFSGLSLAGEVKGSVFELMNDFLNCIQEDFVSK